MRRRFTQPTGTVEINAKRASASAWAGISTPWFTDVPTDTLLEDLAMRLGWAQRTVELPAGRYETLMPPSTVADMMIYLGWSMDGRGARRGVPRCRHRAAERGWGEAHRSAVDHVLRPVRRGPGMRPVCPRHQ